jgi:hypothetical protein
LDRFSFVIYPPHNLALLGVVVLFMGVVWTFTGKVLAPYHGVVRRAEDPSSFWWNVAIYYLIGFTFLVKFI